MGNNEHIFRLGKIKHAVIQINLSYTVRNHTSQ